METPKDCSNCRRNIYNPAKISKYSRPGLDCLKAEVESYMQETEPEHVVAIQWLRVIDPSS